ncbi:MAG TPA: site-specific integrase [Pyrinomonadaceae bacterium]|nr:site-specific integrase [Pyrinomonadaceae bacterium]
MLDSFLTQFLDHLRYERNVSAHTLRNYASDLEQFFEYLAPADPKTGKRTEPDIKQIDHITIREWLSNLHSDHKKKTSIARKLAALRTFFQFLVREGFVELNPAKLVATPRKEKKLPVHLSVEEAVRFIETPDRETDLGKRDRAILELLYATECVCRSWSSSTCATSISRTSCCACWASGAKNASCRSAIRR